MEMLGVDTSVINDDGEAERMPAALESVKIVANNLLHQQSFEDARAIFEKLTEKRKEALPLGMAEYLVSRVDLANSMRLEGAHLCQTDIQEAARSILEETEQDMLQVFGEHDDRTLKCLTCLGAVYLNLSKAEEAEKYLSRAIILYKDVGVDANPLHKLTLQVKLAYTRFLQEKYALAERQQRQSWCSSARMISVDHPDTLQIMIDWARSLARLGHTAEAGNLFIYALEEKLRQGSFDRTAQKAWSELAGLGRAMEEKGLSEKARLIDHMKRRYDMAVFMSVLQQGRVTSEGFNLPELGLTFPVQTVQFVEGDALEDHQEGVHAVPETSKR
jgi:tetratricopeptide (TPR) repeat protein